MPRGRDYGSEQIRFILEAVLRKEHVNDIISSYQARFQKTLRPQQVRYVRIKYGNDPVFNTCLVNRVVKKRKDYDSDTSSSDSSSVKRGKRRKTADDGDTEQNVQATERAASIEPGATSLPPRQVGAISSVSSGPSVPPVPLVPSVSSVPSVPEKNPVLSFLRQHYRNRVPNPLAQTSISTPSSYPQSSTTHSESQTVPKTHQNASSNRYPWDSFPSIDQTTASSSQQGGGPYPDPAVTIDDFSNENEFLDWRYPSKSMSQEDLNFNVETTAPLPYARQTSAPPTLSHDALLRRQLGLLQNPLYSPPFWHNSTGNPMNSSPGAPCTYDSGDELPRPMTPGFSSVFPQPQTWDLLTFPSAYDATRLPGIDDSTPTYVDEIGGIVDQVTNLPSHETSYEPDITFPAPTDRQDQDVTFPTPVEPQYKDDIAMDPEFLPGGKYFPTQEDRTAGQQDQADADVAPIDLNSFFDEPAQVPTTTTPHPSTESKDLDLGESRQDILALFEEMGSLDQPFNDQSIEGLDGVLIKSTGEPTEETVKEGESLDTTWMLGEDLCNGLFSDI